MHFKQIDCKFTRYLSIYNVSHVCLQQLYRYVDNVDKVNYCCMDIIKPPPTFAGG